MNAILQFENHENAAKKFQQTFLQPQLAKAGLLPQTIITFQDYLDRAAPVPSILNPNQVALEASKKWDAIEPPPEKTIWLWIWMQPGQTRPIRVTAFASSWPWRSNLG